jgi:hypothetical protein
VNPETFKSYEQLSTRLKSIMGQKQVKVDESFEDEDDFSAPTKDVDLPTFSKSSSGDEEEDDTLSYFARLAEE